MLNMKGFQKWYFENVVAKASEQKSKFHGIYRGYVEYVNDPMQIGRVKVRVPSIHGVVENTPTDGLPWAYVATSFGGGHDFGSKMIPPVGSTVFVAFESGWKEYPVVLGMWDGVPPVPTPMGRNSNNTLPKGKISMSPNENIPWSTPPGADSPKEFLLQANSAPERYVPFKSVKGAVIDIEDRDDVEHTHIVDRTGQGLFFDGPVKAASSKTDKVASNLFNLAARGLKTANQGDALPLESTSAKEATVSIVDLGSQSITLHTKNNANGIMISSKQSNVEEPTFGGNKEVPGISNATLELGAGHKVINLEITSNGLLVANLSIDGNLGVISLNSPLLTTINSETIALKGDVSVSGTLTVNGAIVGFDNGLFVGEVVSARDTGKREITNIPAPTI